MYTIDISFSYSFVSFFLLLLPYVFIHSLLFFWESNCILFRTNTNQINKSNHIISYHNSNDCFYFLLITVLQSKAQLMTTTMTVVSSELAVDIDTQHKEVLVRVESSRGTYDEGTHNSWSCFYWWRHLLNVNIMI